MVSTSQISGRVGNLVVDAGSHGRRLDNYLISNLPHIPHSRIYKIIRTGQVRVNGSRSKAHKRLAEGDRVRIPPLKLDNSTKPVIRPASDVVSALDQILYEDEFLIALDKPSGIAVHSGSRHRIGLIEAMRQMRPNSDFLELAHRLDKGTSGVLLICKDRAFLRDIHAILRRELDARMIKTYAALLQGVWSGGTRQVELSDSSRNAKTLVAQSEDSGGATVRSASKFVLNRRFDSCTLVDIELQTGRTHQARRHALHLGHPIAGDRRYGEPRFNAEMRKHGLKRIFLHASRLQMLHLRTGKKIDISAPLPSELSHVVNNLSNQSSNGA